MHDEYLALLHASFAVVFERKREIAARFYENLFRAAPEARALFSSDFERQKKMFAAMLAETVSCAETPEDFAERVSAMAESHSQYDISAPVFEAAAKALQDALSETLDGLLSPEEMRVWMLAGRRMTEAMASVTKS